MYEPKHSIIVFFIGYLVLFFLIGLMAWPYFSSIIFAAILAGTFTPVKNRIQNKIGSNKWSAVIICLIIILAIFLPSVFIIIKLSEEAFLLYQSIADYLADEKLNALLANMTFMDGFIQDVFKIANVELTLESIKSILLETSKSASAVIFDIVNASISNVFSFFFQFIVMIIVIYTLLTDGSKIKTFFLNLSPLPDDEEELVIDKFNQINYVTLVGNGIGGVIQGFFAGIGFWFAGIQSIALWTTSMIILAFIPLVGISIIYIPTCIYLLIIGKTTGGIILFIYCTLVAQIVENWFKPKFVGNRTKISSTLVFLSIIGGLSVFGIAGIFYGPLIISIFLTFVELYHKKYSLG